MIVPPYNHHLNYEILLINNYFKVIVVKNVFLITKWPPNFFTTVILYKCCRLMTYLVINFEYIKRIVKV